MICVLTHLWLRPGTIKVLGVSGNFTIWRPIILCNRGAIASSTSYLVRFDNRLWVGVPLLLNRLVILLVFKFLLIQDCLLTSDFRQYNIQLIVVLEHIMHVLVPLHLLNFLQPLFGHPAHLLNFHLAFDPLLLTLHHLLDPLVPSFSFLQLPNFSF